MGEFYMENWDLQAVVGGSNNGVCTTDRGNPQFSFDPWSLQQVEEDVMSFTEIFETNPKVLDELDELYKPFYPDLNPYSTQTIISSSLPVPQDHVDEPVKQKKQQSVSQSAISGSNKDSAKPKRFSRKNQQNRVVQHVTADNLLSDIWAWRKYGQKPIKGSPYPRSYYRCSSLKGCLARKQVERSCSDPRIFIVTYTGEHSHGQPTRRSSLAGSTRNKSLTAATPKGLANKNEPHEETVLLSPTTLKDHEPVKQESVKMEELQMLEDDDREGSKILTPADITLSDELVHQSLENFEDLFLDQFPDLSYEIWSSMNEPATLTDGCS